MLIRDKAEHEQGRLVLRKLPRKLITERWDVYCRDTKLGQVRWWSHWRRYTFEPFAETVFDAGCLTDLATFVEAVTTEHKQQYVAAKRRPGVTSDDMMGCV